MPLTCQITKRKPYTVDERGLCGRPARWVYMGKVRVCDLCKSNMRSSYIPARLFEPMGPT